MVKTIVYLFGAGASNSEVFLNHRLKNEEFDDDKHGIMNNNVSRRILASIKDGELIGDVKESSKIQKFFENHVDPNRKMDIEQLISILESSFENKRNSYGAIIAESLRSLFKKDIMSHIQDGSDLVEPLLYESLLEFHKQSEVLEREKVLAYMTLNYDTLLDIAYKKLIGECQYCTDEKNMGFETPPLLKLHGSFNWKDSIPISVDDTLEIGIDEQNWIPPGILKNYLEYPYNSIWGRATQVLHCDTLRIVGCSLNQNDWSLIKLLFKSQIHGSLVIELIDFDDNGNEIRERLGFLPKIYPFYSIEDKMLDNTNAESHEKNPNANPFNIWLNAKVNKILYERRSLDDTKYLKKTCKLDRDGV